MFMYFITDRFSRKYAIAGSSAVFCVGVLFQVIGYNFGLLCAGRLITGIGSGILGNSIPL